MMHDMGGVKRAYIFNAIDIQIKGRKPSLARVVLGQVVVSTHKSVSRHYTLWDGIVKP